MQAVPAGALCSSSRQRSRRWFAVAIAVLTAATFASDRAAAAPASREHAPREYAGRAPVPGAPALVTRAGTSVEADRTTLELSLSDKASYKIFALDAPPRVVVDLADVRWRIGDAEMPRTVGVIAQLRLGRPKPGTLRLVIDTAVRAKIEGASLQPRPAGGYTLAIVLAGRTPVPVAQMSVAPMSVAPMSVARIPVAPIAADGRLPATASIGAAPLKVSRTPTPRPGEAAAVVGSDRPHGRRGTGSRPTPRSWVVAIDPGHGGVDPGAISSRGLYEKKVTLATAREVRSALQAIGGYKVILTRDTDVFIPLRTRVAIARRAGADVFLSIHADMMEDEAVRGLSVYTVSERASDAEAAALAERENKVDLIAHMDLRGAAPDVTGILIDLAQRDTKNSSARLAELVLSSARSDTLLLLRPHRFAGFAVLKAPDMPSLLIELGFLSNPGDEAALRSPGGRRRLGRAIARGIDTYFNSVEVAKQGG